MPLCGHATLASAAALFSGMGNVNRILNFKTKFGILMVAKNSDASGSSPLLEMALPLLLADKALPAGVDEGRLLTSALGPSVPRDLVRYE